MRHFRLKKTITHATVLSALFPTGVALSHQVHIPIGLNSQVVIAASASALLGHQVTPAGLSPMDPKSAPSRGGYVYDAFNRVTRTGVTKECVKHGFWTPEVATPDCEPWLFAAPQPAAAPAKAAEPAPAPAPKPEPKAQAPKADEGFPEWIGPDEWRQGIIPIWPENEFQAPDNIGQPRMYFNGDEAAHDEHTDDLISAPTLYGEHPEHDGGDADHISAPIVYFDGGDGAAAGDDLISAPRLYGDDEGGAPAQDSQWPSDPYAAGIPEEDLAAEESNDKWMPTPAEGGAAAAAPSSGVMEFKEEGVWPANPYPGEYIEDQPATASDDSWVIPNQVPGTGGDEAIAAYEEGGKDPEEAISNPIMYFDTEDHGVTPPEDIIGHTLVQGDDEAGAAGPDDLISAPRLYEDTASAAAPYDGSEFKQQPFPETAQEDEPEGEPFTAHFAPQDAGAAAPAETAPAPVQITDSGLAWQPGEEEEDETDDYPSDSAAPLMARDATADLPYPGKGAVDAAADNAPAYGFDEDEEDAVEDTPYVADYSKVPSAKGAHDTLPAPSAAAPAPEQPAAPAPAKEEEHLMTVVLSADALFEFDRYAVRKGGNKSLKEFVEAVKQVKWGQIVVVGHTDRLGSDKYNQRLSERRAQTVRRELIKLGLDGKKIKAVGKGKTEPVTKDCVGDKRSKALIECLQPDRRVEIFVDEKQQVIIKKAPGKK